MLYLDPENNTKKKSSGKTGRDDTPVERVTTSLREKRDDGSIQNGLNSRCRQERKTLGVGGGTAT